MYSWNIAKNPGDRFLDIGVKVYRIDNFDV
jgi:hypothetical protein